MGSEAVRRAPGNPAGALVLTMLFDSTDAIGER